MSDCVLSLTGISKRFGALVANDAISLDLKAGEILALLGENGAGKSTLVSILFGHYTADAGSITVFGKPLAPGGLAIVSDNCGCKGGYFGLIVYPGALAIGRT